MLILLFSCNTAPKPDTTEALKNGQSMGALFQTGEYVFQHPEVSFFDLFQKAEIIPLDTKPESMIADFRFGKKVLFGGRLYIHDTHQKAILIFDLDGKFVRKVQKIGKGPGEYNYLNDFQINPFTGNLELLNPMGYIYVYDILGETYIETIKLYHVTPAAHYFASLTPDLRVLYCDVDGNMISIYSREKDQMIKGMYSLPRYLHGTPFMVGHLPFQRVGSSVCFTSPFNGDVFTIDTVSFDLIPRFRWNVGKYRFEMSVLPKNEDKAFYTTFHEQSSDRYAYNFWHVGENQLFFVSTCLFRHKGHTLFFDKKNNKSWAITSFKEGVRCIFPTFMDEDGIYNVIGTSDINQYVNAKIMDEENMKKVQALTDLSNPVIIKYRFK